MQKNQQRPPLTGQKPTGPMNLLGGHVQWIVEPDSQGGALRAITGGQRKQHHRAIAKQASLARCEPPRSYITSHEAEKMLHDHNVAEPRGARSLDFLRARAEQSGGAPPRFCLGLRPALSEALSDCRRRALVSSRSGLRSPSARRLAARSSCRCAWRERECR